MADDPPSPLPSPPPLPVSRPLSEISDNSDPPSRRRSTANLASANRKSSRPNSEVKDIGSSGAETKRLSASIPAYQTISINLVDYARNNASAAGPHLGAPLSPASGSSSGAGAAKERTKGLREESAVGATSQEEEKPKAAVVDEGTREPIAKDGAGATPSTADTQLPETSAPSDGSALLQAKRASLRPSPLSGPSYAEATRVTSPALAVASASTPLSPPSSASSASPSFDSLRSATDLPKPPTKAKPSWLRRASGTANLQGFQALRTKSRSPVHNFESPPALSSSTSLPPALPPRREMASTSSHSIAEEGEHDSGATPPEVPPKSYASAAAGPSRSRLGDGEGRPAYSPSLASPPLPPRDKAGANVGNIRGRLAAWTAAAAQSSSSSFSRSESSMSLASVSGSSTFVRERVPSSAQRVLGNAGSAVQKGWAGLRARGVGGSISSMSALAGPSSNRRGPMEASSSWSGGLGRGSNSRDRTQSADAVVQGMANAADGPVFEEGVILRPGGDRPGRVFGRDLEEVGKNWPVSDADGDRERENDWEKRRRSCLPAVVVRAVEYLEVWGPKEEGIFRISGRSSHISRLRKEFDAGADLDLKRCHPGDLDPHAVSGIFKTYLRELPSPLLTHSLAPRFDRYTKRKDGAAMSDDEETEGLAELLKLLPSAHWFLLADIVRLLDLVSQHRAVNRMTLNAVMLSLGPSLNIPGPILTELLERRVELFSSPPDVSAAESARDLIDFGDTPLAPPVNPATLDEGDVASRAPTPSSQHTTESFQIASLANGSVKKRSPRLPSKPSFGRLFSAGSLSNKNSVESFHSSIVQVDPPKVELPLGPTSLLPSFENASSSSPSQQITDAKMETLADASEQPFDDPAVVDVQYAKGTVEERAKLFSGTSTPIADKFATSGSGGELPPLRKPKSAVGSLATSASIPHASSSQTAVPSSPPPGSPNPATVIRRGQPVFFASQPLVGGEQRPGGARSRSATASTLPRSHGADTPPLNKRSSTAAAADEDGEGEGGVLEREKKRLSAGPGVIRGMEMMA